MQKALQEMIRSKLTTVQRIEVSNDRLGDQDVLTKVVQSDIEKIRMSLEEMSRQEFSAVVDAIVGARRIYILGVRSSAALSDFIAFYFNLIFDNVSHGKLLKQLWTIGIQDKKLISIISAMLKGEIAGIGFPEKGTAQVDYFTIAIECGVK